ncbi:hypothetical protein ACH5RR_022387 [Cinchona calisaya]|uniref:Ubiquitin-like protease family profile domain-containing protein n=1 Tax=Cinchona calisaya TaxID=153742 RepID=A0ABD2ZAY0_9GENT
MVKPSKSSRGNNNSSINKNYTNNKFSVYEFDRHDLRVEKDSQKILSKFKTKNPNCNKLSSSPADKYCFLRFFSQGTKTIEDDFENELVDIDNSFNVMDKRIHKWDAAVSGLSKPEPLARSSADFLDSECSFHGDKYCAQKGRKLGVRNEPLCVDSEDEQDINKPLRNEPICVDSDDDLRNDCSSSISSSDPAGDEGSFEEQLPSHGSITLDAEAAFIVKPDCIIFGNMYSTSSQLTFSSRSVKLEGSTLCVEKISFSFNWSLADVIEIASFWCREVETAIVYLRLKSEDEKAAELDTRFSGIMKLHFSVNDPQWFKKQEAIESLHMIYKDAWTTVVHIDPIPSEFSCLELNSMSFSKGYSPNGSNSPEIFEDVIYPQGDPDAVSLSKKDIELLQPATFINDTIIDFYIKYLEQSIKPDEKHRFHFFNSFFFRKLVDLDKDRSTACEGRAAFQRVRKWTKKVNLFEKDYLFIPVNFSLHWSLIVVCHPGEVAYYRDEVVEKSSKVPCVLHMDSIRGIHRGLKNLFQTYLLEEWRERHNDLFEDVSTNFLSLPYISLELPQQENSFDCGLFVLYYVERFLQQAPANFSPLNEASNFLNKEWFQPAEASSRRDFIKKLMYKVCNDNAQKDPLPANEPKYPLHTILERDIGNEFLREKCDGREARRVGYSAQNADEGIRETSQAATPTGNLQHWGEPNFIPGVILGGHTARSVAKQTYQHHGKSESLNQSCNNMSPIKEEEATGEQTVFSSIPRASRWQAVASVSGDSMLLDEDVEIFPVKSLNSLRDEEGWQVEEATGEQTTFSSINKSGGRQTISVSGDSMHLDHEDVEIGAIKSLNSLEVQDEEEGFVPNLLRVSVSEERDKKNDTSSMSREELDYCVVEDSVEGDRMLIIEDSENSISSEARTRTMTLHDIEVESPINTDVKANHDKQLLHQKKSRLSEG